MARRKRKVNKKRTKYKQQNRRHNQIGGMLPGLILGFVKAKKQKKKFKAGDYLKKAFNRRVAVAKVASGKKIPTPGNTGMSVGDFFKSGLLGIG